MVSALFLATLLTLSDPAGDAVGNGTLAAPTASTFRSAEAFDLRTVSVPDAATFGVALEYALIPPPDAFPQAITELYLHDAEAAARGRAGRAALLPGSGMHLPEGRGWHAAFRVVGETVQMFSPDGAPSPEAFPDEVTGAYGARVRREGNTLFITTALQMPGRFSLYGMTGVYDPFSETGWRALRAEPSPWGFSSLDQGVPVLDVITDTYAQQQGAINAGVLPEIRAPVAQEGWLLLAGAGVVVALLGLTARFLVRRDAPHSVPKASPDAAPRPDLPLAPPTPALRMAALEALREGRATLTPAPTPSPPKRAPQEATGGEPAGISAVVTPTPPVPEPTKRPQRVLVVRRPEPPVEAEEGAEPQAVHS